MHGARLHGGKVSRSRVAAVFAPVGGVGIAIAVARTPACDVAEKVRCRRAPWQLSELVDRADKEGRCKAVDLFVDDDRWYSLVASGPAAGAASVRVAAEEVDPTA